MGFGAMGASLLAGAAVGVGVDAGVNQVRTADLLRPLRVVINLLLVLVLVWPALTWLNVFLGMFALKPVNRAQQEYRHFQTERPARSPSRTWRRWPMPRLCTTAAASAQVRNPLSGGSSRANTACNSVFIMAP